MKVYLYIEIYLSQYISYIKKNTVLELCNLCYFLSDDIFQIDTLPIIESLNVYD